MLKIEEECETYNFDKEFLPKKRLKICTMKIEGTGLAIGKEFIKIIFSKAKELGVDEIYITIFPKYKDLINFFSNYGFKYYCNKKTMNSNDEILLERVYVKGVVYE